MTRVPIEYLNPISEEYIEIEPRKPAMRRDDGEANEDTT